MERRVIEQQVLLLFCMNVLYIMRQTKRRIIKNTKKGGLRNTKKNNTKKRITKKRITKKRNTTKMIKGGLDVYSVLDHLIAKNLNPAVQRQVDEIVLHDPTPGNGSNVIEHNKIIKIKRILNRANNESAQLFQIDGEEDKFKAVLFNHLFRRLNKILTRPVTAGQLDAFGQDHSTGIIHDIKDSEIIDDLDNYGYGQGVFEDDTFTDEFKDKIYND
jgi:hypothetical protein